MDRGRLAGTYVSREGDISVMVMSEVTHGVYTEEYLEIFRVYLEPNFYPWSSRRIPLPIPQCTEDDTINTD
jgi:hypothetical protein